MVPGSDSGRDEIFLLFERPDRLKGPPRLIRNGYRDSFPEEGRPRFRIHGAIHLLPQYVLAAWSGTTLILQMKQNGTRIQALRPGLDNLLAVSSRLVLGFTQPPIQRVPRSLSRALIRPRRGADYSPQFSVKVTNVPRQTLLRHTTVSLA